MVEHVVVYGDWVGSPIRTPIAAAAEAFQVTEQDILGRRRTARIAAARHTAMWLHRQQGSSYPTIGRIFGRHHTSIMHGVAHAQACIRWEYPAEWQQAIRLYSTDPVPV